MLLSFKTNVIGNIYLFKRFLPLILRGQTKKVIAMSAAMSDINITRSYDVDMGVSYSVTKAALNSAVSKFSAQYRGQGVLFMCICPGTVDTGTPGHSTYIMQVRISCTGRGSDNCVNDLTL